MSRTSRRLPVVAERRLDDVVISSPCTVPWAQMAGNAWVRHCSRCDLNVYNLSELTRAEATALIQRVEGRLCVQLRRRPDGTIITRDCWSRVLAARRRGLLAAIGATILVFPVAVLSVVQGFRSLRKLLLPRVEELHPK